MSVMERTHAAFQSRRVAIEMMRTRGYTVEAMPWDEDIQVFARLCKRVQSYFNLAMVAQHPTLPPCVLLWPFEEKLRVTTIRDQMIAWAQERNCKHLIIVYSESVTTCAQTYLRSRANAHPRIETCSLDFLQFNLLQHRMVPPHRILSAQEKSRLLKELGDVELPKILYQIDPVAVFLGCRPGQVVEILRPSPEGFLYPAYRVCARGTLRMK